MYRSKNKILLIGLPRCGSQYISQLIGTNFKYNNIDEPFTYKHVNSIVYADNMIKICDSINFIDQNHRIDYTFNILSKAKLEDRILLKYFPYTQGDSISNSVIVSKLINLGYTPIILKRSNLEQHLLSFLVAWESNVWYSTNKNFKHDRLVIADFGPLFWLKDMYRELNEMTKSFNSQYPIIEYENAEDDIKKLFSADNIERVASVKLRTNDPYDGIANVDQVKDIVSRFIIEIINAVG